MIKIGFLRYFNEENTILACLKSHNYCDYIFCFTHLPRNGVKIDKSTEIIENYVKENNLQDKIFLVKYNEIVYPPASKEVLNKEVTLPNLTAGFYNFGWNTIKSFIKENKLDLKDLVVFKIDGDIIDFSNGEIYKNPQYEEILLKDIVGQKGGFTIVAKDGRFFLHHDKFGERNDYFCIPGRLLMNSYFIHNGRYELLLINDKFSIGKISSDYRYCHFIDYSKIEFRHENGYEDKKSYNLNVIDKNSEIGMIINTKVIPILQETESKYKNYTL